MTEEGCDARDRRARRPMGRRGQRQGHRPAGHHGPDRLRGPHQRRPQRRPHHRDQRREVRHPPAAQRHPHAGCHVGDRRRGGRLPGGAVPRARRADRPRRRGRRPQGQRQRARDRAATTRPSTRSPSASSARTRSARRAAASARPTPTRSTGSAYASPDLFDEKILREKVEAALDVRNHLLTKVYNRRAIEVDAVVEELAVVRRPAAADGLRHLAAAQPGARRRPDRAVRGRAGDHARRRPRHLSVRHVLQPRGRRRLRRRRHRTHPHRPGDRRDQGLHDARRLGPVPHRALRRGRRPAPAARRRDRRLDRSHPPLRLVRRRRRALRQPGQRPHRVLPHQARHPRRAGSRSRSAWPTRSTASGSRRCR